MEPISLIVTALVAGAVAAAKDTAEKGVKDTYQGLKTLIKRKFANDPLAQAMVEAKPEDIKKDEGLLMGLRHFRAAKKAQTITGQRVNLDL
ncbi:hypothetical protein M8120_18020 [Microcystis aeruginosa str. Chao 1910]|jgi:disulfide oxidoreductase YuzD|nr:MULTISPECIES: hypothetical protein [Microcystis]UZO74750.1 hypothetical protein M8120_18020 [Microcystis aeruginosa str. Chao 1910]